jgi:PAS domain-containing protein
MDEGHTSIMSRFYGHQYHGNGVERGQEQQNGNVLMGLMGPNTMDPNMMGGQTLDEIISQNNKEIQRRRSYQQLYDPGRPSEEDLRQSSMMEFGPGGNSELDGYQFDLSPVHPGGRIGRGNDIAARRGESHRGGERHQPRAGISLNTQFHDLSTGYNAIPQATSYPQQLNPSDPLDMDVTGPFLPAGLPMGMDFTATSLDQDAGGDLTSLNMFTQSDYQPTLTTSTLHQAFPSSFRGPAQDPGGGNAGRGDEQDLMEKMPNMQMSDHLQSMQPTLRQTKGLLQADSPTAQVQGLPGLNASNEAQPGAAVVPVANSKIMGFTTEEPMPNAVGQELPKFNNVYSSSGFDMLGVLMRVAARPNPQISIGAVDMSCAFVVCDVTQHDIPIVYCSDIFERLTGYTRFEILGRNCRFLQAPDGKVQSGVKRKYVDDDIIFHLKHMVTKRSEVQTSLINYRKGGQPFMNLLTMIPITWDSDEIKYYVGFQVDLVETPNSVTNKNPGKLSTSYSTSWV